MMMRKMMLGILIVIMAGGCAAPRPALSQATPANAAATPTATRVRGQRPTPTATAPAAATATPTVKPTVAPTVAPSATPTPQLTVTTSPLSTAVALANQQASPPTVPPTTGGVSAGVLLPLNPSKYPVPTLLAPDNNVTYHVSQPVVHFAWSPTPTDLMTFGQTPGCVSDATNFRRAFESYQLVIHSLEGVHPDIMQWTENDPEFDLNLTTVPAGHYSWRVNVVTLCESYVVGKRTETIQRSLVAPASPTSATRMISWVP